MWWFLPLCCFILLLFSNSSFSLYTRALAWGGRLFLLSLQRGDQMGMGLLSGAAGFNIESCGRTEYVRVHRSRED